MQRVSVCVWGGGYSLYNCTPNFLNIKKTHQELIMIKHTHTRREREREMNTILLLRHFNKCFRKGGHACWTFFKFNMCLCGQMLLILLNKSTQNSVCGRRKNKHNNECSKSSSSVAHGVHLKQGTNSPHFIKQVIELLICFLY